VTSWRFVGRAHELSLITSTATGDTGRGLILSGEAGIGKSRLLREAVATLDSERFAIWTASANTATSGLPFGSFAHTLPVDQPAGLSPAGLLRWAIDALHQQAAGRPIVLAVDDIQLVDPLSAALINLIARSAHATVLATLRTGEHPHDSIATLWKDDLVERVDLAPFSPDETAELLGDALGGEVDEAATARLHRLSQGNALLLRELVLSARAGDFTEAYGLWRWSGRPELGPSLVEVIDERVGQLDDNVRMVLELVALGEPLGLEVVAQATDPRAVEVAEERQLIRIDIDDRRSTVRLGHPLYGEVVRRRCPVTRSRRLLARLAEIVEAMGSRRRDDLLRVAVWRLESDTARDPEQLLNAGRQAYAKFDMPLAARLVRAARVAEAGAGGDRRGGFDAAELLATILMFGDLPSEALEVLDEVSDQLDTGTRQARWHTVRALATYWGMSMMETTDELMVVAESLPDPADRAWVTGFAAIQRLHQNDCEESLRLARSVLDRPAAGPSPRALAHSTIAHVQALRGATTQAARTAASVEATASSWRQESPHIQVALELARGTALILAGDVAGVETIAAGDFADQTDAGEFHLGSGHLSVVLGQAARLRGRLGEAMRHQRRACSMLAAGRIFSSLANAERAHVAALAGDSDSAELAMAEADRVHTATMAVLYPWLEHARCWVRASAGDVRGAATQSLELAERLAADGFHGHELVALHDVVRLGRADLVVDRLGDLIGRVEGPLPAIMADHARVAVEQDAIGLLIAAEQFAGYGLCLHAAEAAAEAYNRLRETRSGKANDAARLFTALLDCCDGPRTPALAVSRPQLSPRERQIAWLAAAGVSSKGIADELFLSARTIDNHLRRVYAKLGVNGRGQLAAALRAMADGR
jgi:ATP/maltotriose-dependent transcriptional regulator MalT